MTAGGGQRRASGAKEPPAASGTAQQGPAVARLGDGSERAGRDSPPGWQLAVRDRSARAERAVADHLRAQGYEIVATNLHVGRLEIDVVARRRETVVVVEVRHRGAGAWTSGFGSIDARKRQRVRRAGERLWQRRYRDDPSVDRMRFDAASVSFDGDRAVVEYAEAAF